MMRKNIAKVLSVALSVPLLSSTIALSALGMKTEASEPTQQETPAEADGGDEEAAPAESGSENNENAEAGTPAASDSAGESAEANPSEGSQGTATEEANKAEGVDESADAEGEDGQDSDEEEEPGAGEEGFGENAEKLEGAEDEEELEGEDDLEEEAEPESEESALDRLKNKVAGASESAEENSYTGISVEDNDLSDWDNVTKTDASSYSNGNIGDTAIAFDGDYVYLYITEKKPNYGSWAGENSTGNLVITTDLGYDMVIKLGNNNEVTVYDPYGNLVDVISYSDYTQSDWNNGEYCFHRELAIPASALPYYKNTVSFGYYLGDTFISDVSNLDGSKGNIYDDDEDSDGDGGSDIGADISVDGDTSDWNGEIHTSIEYDTAGTHRAAVDASGAITSDGENVYVHATTANEKFTGNYENGGQKGSQTNGNEYQEFHVSLDGGNSYVTVTTLGLNDDGSYNWDLVDRMPSTEEGTYRFVLYDVTSWQNFTSADSQGAKVYGEMVITIKRDANGIAREEAEFYLDTEALAKYNGMDANSLSTVSVNFHRIGDKWLTSAGTSTGPWTGLAICLIPTALIFYRKKNLMELQLA